MQAYSDLSRESEPTALPDIEVWQAQLLVCPRCDKEEPWNEDRDHDQYCSECSFTKLAVPVGEPRYGWYWWSCFPGCLPDGDPVGPFATEDKALADARE